jgi:hypothetical protein
MEICQRIAAIRRGADDRAAAEILAHMSREQEQREQERTDRLDQERRAQLEELDRRNEAFLKTRRDPPDRGGHDPGSGGEAGRAPPA